MGISLNLSPKVQELGHPWRKFPSESDGLGSRSTIEWGKEEMVVPTQTESEFALSLSFVLFRIIYVTHPQGRGWSALLSIH